MTLPTSTMKILLVLSALLAAAATSKYHPEYSRTLYLTRHGESWNNVYGRIGGDAGLSPRGEQYAAAIAAFVKNLAAPIRKVITSRLRRIKQTAACLSIPKEENPDIDVLNFGDINDLTNEEFASWFPTEFAQRDNLHYRYPNGESYMDVVKRLKPLVAELERDDNILVISHGVTIRCILTLLLKTPLTELPFLEVPLHTVIKLNFNNAGVTVEYIRLPVPLTGEEEGEFDTYRAIPQPTYSPAQTRSYYNHPTGNAYGVHEAKPAYCLPSTPTYSPAKTPSYSPTNIAYGVHDGVFDPQLAHTITPTYSPTKNPSYYPTNIAYGVHDPQHAHTITPIYSPAKTPSYYPTRIAYGVHDPQPAYYSLPPTYSPAKPRSLYPTRTY